VSNISPSFENKSLILHLNAHVQNSNFYAVTLKKSNLKISLEDKELGDLTLTDKVVFTRKSEAEYPVKMQVKLADGAMFTILRNVFKKELSIHIQGSLKGSVMGIPKTIRIDETKNMDASLLKSLSN
jgi:hypothetical protein